MHIHEYQAWLQEWDSARGWDKTLVSHTLLHAVEEMGEVSRLVQMIEGYRTPSPADKSLLRESLALELSDLQIMLFKIAYLCGIDMEDAMTRGIAKADRRFPDPTAGPGESAAAWERFRAYVAQAGLAGQLRDPGNSSS